jgi:tripartite-type tricarboxylate transporter receptor subunit TctC
VVENRPGANGALAAMYVARSAPDGYTLLMATNSPLSAVPFMMKKVPYDPIKDFTPVTRMGSFTLMLVMHPSIPAKNVKELIAYAKANPGKLSYGSGGIGAITHITPELFKQRAGGLDILHVPYRGIAPAMNDLLGGNIGVIFPNITSQVVALHRSGKLRILAVNAPARLDAAPDIPTAQEEGLGNFVSQIFFGIFAAIGTPKPILEQLNDVTQAEWADKAFQAKLIEQGFEPMLGYGPDRSDQYMRDEFAKWGPVVQKVRGP